MKNRIVLLSVVLLVTVLSVGVGQKSPSSLSPLEELGKKLFFDRSLSTPPGQDCAACHVPDVGMTGPDEEINKKGGVYEGAVRGRFGNRKPPAAAYAGDSPVLHIDKEGNFVGGMFWDGRATGESLGDPLAEQAMGPFLNPLEQNMPDKKSIVLKVQESGYAALFEKVWGKGSLDAGKDVDRTFERIARSIAAYERSSEVNPFNSKFDDFWRKAKAAGLDVASIDESNWEKFDNMGLDQVELRGLVLFNGQSMCFACHVLTSVDGEPPLFTDFTYDNLGIPRNPDNPFYKMPKEWNSEGEKWADEGLGGFLKGTEKYAKHAAENIGKHKVPTLRNVALSPRPGFVKAYMHNGYFKTLKDVVHFYNARDVDSEKWPAPEVLVNVNVDEMGDLELTAEEEDAIVAFMKTLSDKI
ncbi:MAG TPA: cytochrome c peroxidase [Candidatus Desulfaltia sp.]|nr:cytochrome c peroxidase [Candidatus Desulfaltia sp.]